METIIKTRSLCKSYDSTPTLTNINFEVKKGELIGLLGSNGADKTTLLKLLGFYKKSVILPIVTATILVSPFGNSVMFLGTDADFAFIVAGGVLLIVSAFLFGGLLKRVNRMECV